MVNNTIASSYIDLVFEKVVDVGDGVVKFLDITNKSIIEIKSVSICNGQKMNFKIFKKTY